MRGYDDFMNGMSSDVQDLFGLLREYCLSLGDNVVEDVRAHRVVFAKSFSFRWFLDAMPTDTQIQIKIKRSRKEPTIDLEIESLEDLQNAKPLIGDAFLSLR